MILSPDYKRFKRINFTGDTFTLLDMRSSIIRTIQRYHSHKNTVNLKRFEKEAQINEIETQKTDRLLSVCDRALFAISYADTVIISGHPARLGGYLDGHPARLGGYLDGHPARLGGYVLHGQVYTKPKTYPIIEMEEHFLVYCSYATKYHKLTSMNIPGYQCSNVYINVEKRASMNKDIQ